jgi:hypothetical protein
MKIKNITINKYKSFQKEESIPIDSKNLFVYGENGAGKSSFYYALKDFFQSSVEDIKMSKLRNMFLTDGTDCSIEVEFDGGTKNILNETTKSTKTVAITDANRLKSFITYKHLLAVHNIKIDKKINVFDLLIKGVLKHYKSSLTNGIELGVIWDEVVTEHNKGYGTGEEFYFARQKKKSVEEKAIKFNTIINALFLKPDADETKPDYLAPSVNKILKKFIPELHIEFNRHTIIVNEWGRISEPKILLEIEYNGTNLDNNNPQFILNEARLSAIAISIFLGTILKQSPFSKEIKPLFLDDILIGLDNANRIKLIKVLKEDFISPDPTKDFQIFITSYDRHWYEVAKTYLPKWKFVEFYKGDTGPVVIHNQQTNIQKAISYLDAYDFPACANYLRKECERVLIDKLPDTHTIKDGVKGLVKPPSLQILIDNLKHYYDAVGVYPPTDLLTNLYIYKTVLFNPMSHNNIESPIYKSDLDKAFKVIEELDKLILPSRKILVEKGTVFNINLTAITYVAEIEIAENIYEVDNNSTKTISPVYTFFKHWNIEGVDYAKMAGSPPESYSGTELLQKIIERSFSINEATENINKTYSDRGVPIITSEDILKNMVLSGNVLFDILNPV